MIHKNSFIAATRALRKLAKANFSTKLARLNAIMESSNGDTHVSTLSKWRGSAFGAEFVQDLVRGPGERKARTARDLIKYLCSGSPVARGVFQELLTIKALEKLDNVHAITKS